MSPIWKTAVACQLLAVPVLDVPERPERPTVGAVRERPDGPRDARAEPLPVADMDADPGRLRAVVERDLRHARDIGVLEGPGGVGLGRQVDGTPEGRNRLVHRRIAEASVVLSRVVTLLRPLVARVGGAVVV